MTQTLVCAARPVLELILGYQPLTSSRGRERLNHAVCRTERLLSPSVSALKSARRDAVVMTRAAEAQLLALLDPGSFEVGF